MNMLGEDASPAISQIHENRDDSIDNGPTCHGLPPLQKCKDGIFAVAASRGVSDTKFFYIMMIFSADHVRSLLTT